MKKNNKLSAFSRVLLVLAALMLCISIFVPIWRIDLDAPQYPEGLRLLIYADKLGGNVDIINGLNHYIGMKTLHAEEFIEFTVLPYIIGFYALLALVTAIAGRRRLLYILFALFVLFGIVAMYDFWRWEYDYGHNLDPNAAIIVPGMAYQPPLIGFKQLLNFGAYSIPDIGGWLFIAAGVCMLISIFMEYRRNRKLRTASVAAAIAGLTLFSCSAPGPEPIVINKDNCSFCKMTISDLRFAAETVTAKGRIYKYDDLSCLKGAREENTELQKATHYVCDYLVPGKFLELPEAHLVQHENVRSPMGGNTAAFSHADSAARYTSIFAAAGGQ